AAWQEPGQRARADVSDDRSENRRTRAFSGRANFKGSDFQRFNFEIEESSTSYSRRESAGAHRPRERSQDRPRTVRSRSGKCRQEKRRGGCRGKTGGQEIQSG